MGWQTFMVAIPIWELQGGNGQYFHSSCGDDPRKVFLHLFLLSLLLILICPFLVDFCYLIFFFPSLTDSPLPFPPPYFPFIDFPLISFSLSFSSSLPYLSLFSSLPLSFLSPWPFYTTLPTPPSGLFLWGLLSSTSRGRHHCSLFPSPFGGRAYKFQHQHQTALGNILTYLTSYINWRENNQAPGYWAVTIHYYYEREIEKLMFSFQNNSSKVPIY